MQAFLTKFQHTETKNISNTLLPMKFILGAKSLIQLCKINQCKSLYQQTREKLYDNHLKRCKNGKNNLTKFIPDKSQQTG